VSWDNGTNSWKAMRTLEGRQIRKSGFSEEIDAACAADDILRENNAYSRKFNFPSKSDTKLRRLAKLAQTKHGYFGVSRVGEVGWKAQRYCAGKQIQSKTFTSKEFAAHKSDEIWRQHAGTAFDEAMLNFPEFSDDLKAERVQASRPAPEQSMDFTGVEWDPKVGKYRAEHVINHNRCFGGFFVSAMTHNSNFQTKSYQEAAAVGADELLRKHGIHHGKLNFPRRGEWKQMRTGPPSPGTITTTKDNKCDESAIGQNNSNRSFSPRQIIAISESGLPQMFLPKPEFATKTVKIAQKTNFPPPLENSAVPTLEASRPEILRLCDKNRQLKEKCNSKDAEIGRLKRELKKSSDPNGLRVLLEAKTEELDKAQREIKTARRRLEFQKSNFSKHMDSINEEHQLEIDDLRQENDELKRTLKNMREEILRLRCVD